LFDFQKDVLPTYGQLNDANRYTSKTYETVESIFGTYLKCCKSSMLGENQDYSTYD
jgi:hypothetical protein